MIKVETNMGLCLRLCAILIFTGFSVSAQPDNARNYFQNINQAELSITQGDYKLAISYYDSAFNSNIFFAKDIYNSIVCDVKSEHLKLASSKCWVLANKGVGSSFFKKSIQSSFKNDTYQLAFSLDLLY